MNNIMVQSVIYEIYILTSDAVTGFQPQTINVATMRHMTLWRKVEV